MGLKDEEWNRLTAAEKVIVGAILLVLALCLATLVAIALVTLAGQRS